MKIKTIDVNAKEWFDKINGNSYFSCNITVNFGMKTAKSFYIPMHYGYGNQYEHEAFRELQKQKIIKKQETNISYWRYYEENNIIYRYSKKDKCLKKEL